MRDEHLDSGHQEAKSQAKLLPSNLDLDEVQPLLFDLIRLNKVEEVKGLLPYLRNLSASVQTELKQIVASSRSASMAQVVCERVDRDFLVGSIKGMNFETFRWGLCHIYCWEEFFNMYYVGKLLIELLKAESLEMFQECEEHLIDELSTRNQKSMAIRACPSVSTTVIKATARDPDREKHLLSLWAVLKKRRATSMFDDQKNLGDALTNVAKTTCSLALAKALLEYGAEIDFRRSDYYHTPLHHAARQSSPQAAELMKLLLYQGADPKLTGCRSKLDISDEKGAKEISKWLDMSWDELVQKIKLDRERGICPAEYR